MNIRRYSKLLGTLAGLGVAGLVTSYMPDTSPDDVATLKDAVGIGITLLGTYLAPANK